jgi:hypothetical protein
MDGDDKEAELERGEIMPNGGCRDRKGAAYLFPDLYPYMNHP